MNALAAGLGCISLAACGSAADSGGSSQAAAALEKAPFRLGVNVSGINNWDGNRPFLNLIYGSSWQMQSTRPSGVSEDVPAASLDADGWVKSVPVGYRLLRSLSVPLGGGNFVCRYLGNGRLNVEGTAVSKVTMGAGVTRFTLATTYPSPQPALLTYTVDPTNYIRNIDCRESGASIASALAPEFISALTGFKVIRFMDWQTATGSNARMSWSGRNKPGDGDYLKNDGVPVEVIVQTANDVGADPWVTVPWNANDDYVTHFATYVRDNLAPGRRVYVEVSNEVWNGSSPVGVQACNEAKAENLPGMNSSVGCNLERYAEKTKQVMQLWSNVFAGQMGKLVRVASLQHVSPYWSDAALRYGNLYQSVDALATAPYFGNEITGAKTANEILAALLADADNAVALGVQQKMIARKYGLRYVTYEGGQSVVLANDVALEQQVQRDPRMYDVYKRFLAAWQKQVSGDLNLYNFAGGISKYGAWGLTEYVGQPLPQAPKLRAVKEFLRSTTAAKTMPICTDQSVAIAAGKCSG